MPTPLMRASHIQSNLASVEILGAGEAHRVRHALGDSRVATIEQAGRMEWLPLEIDVALTDAVGEVVGMDGVRRWARTSIQQSLDGPLLGPLRDGAVRLFGLAPAKILKWAPRAWSHVYKNAGTLRFLEPEDAEARVELHHRDPPPDFRDSKAVLESVAASFAAIFDLCHVTGEAEIASVDKTRVVFQLRW
jgi:hypothetical protein